MLRRARVALSGMPRRRAATLGAALLVACGDGRPARGDGVPIPPPGGEALADAMVSSGASARRVADYELSEDNIEAWFEADAALAALAEEDAAVAERLERESATRRGERDPIRRSVARLDAVPEARDALDEAGMTPYDYVMTGLALHQALLAAAPASPPTLRRLAARNAAFVQRHADVLARYAERRPRYMASGDPDDGDVPMPDPGDTLAWLDTATAAGELPPDSAYPVDTARPMPATLPAPGDTVAPVVPAPVLPATLPATLPESLPAPARPIVPETLPTPPPVVPRPAPAPPPAG